MTKPLHDLRDAIEEAQYAVQQAEALHTAAQLRLADARTAYLDAVLEQGTVPKEAAGFTIGPGWPNHAAPQLSLQCQPCTHGTLGAHHVTDPACTHYRKGTP